MVQALSHRVNRHWSHFEVKYSTEIDIHSGFTSILTNNIREIHTGPVIAQPSLPYGDSPRTGHLWKDVSVKELLIRSLVHLTWVHRVPHALDVAADNGLTGNFRLAKPHYITWRGSGAMPSFPIHYKYMGGWFDLKSITHGAKWPIVLCLPIDVGRKFSWLKLARNCRFICGIQQTKSSKLYMFTCKRQAWDLSRQSTSISSIIYQHFPSRNLCDLTWSWC